MARGWANALSDANALADGTCSLSDGSSAGDWRLPNVNELHRLVVGSGQTYPALPPGHPFSGVQAYYWSSTTSAYYTSFAWYVDLGDDRVGSVSDVSKLNNRYVWPVRGGQ